MGPSVSTSVLTYISGISGLGLQPLDHNFQKLPRPPGQGVHSVGFLGTGNDGGEDVFTAERHGAAGERDRGEQAVVVDFSQAGSTIALFRKAAVVLDAKTADLVRTLLDVREGIEVQVIHHVAGVVIDLDALVGHFAGDGGTGGSGAGVAAVLFDNEEHAVLPGDRPQFLETLDPDLVV